MRANFKILLALGLILSNKELPALYGDDTFIYFVDASGQESEGTPLGVEASPTHGPSVRVVRTELGFSVSCDSTLYSEMGYYYNMALEAHIFSPGGDPIGSATNDAFKPSLTINAVGFDPTPEDGEYRCVTDNKIDGQLIGQSVSTLLVTIRWPTSLSNVSDTYLNQAFNNYNREYVYQVRDQSGGSLEIGGLSVTESYSITNNGCNISSIQTAQASTNIVGQFKDNYFWNDIPGCSSSPSCTVTATQTIRVAGLSVRTNQVVYGCSSVSVTPQ